MTNRALALLAVGTALLVAALSTGTAVYYYGVLLIALMLVYSVFSVVWTYFTLRVRMKGGKARAVRGETIACSFSVQHGCLLPVGSICLRVEGNADGREITVQTPPFIKKSFRGTIACPHRGVYDIGVSGVSVHDLFGVFSWSGKRCAGTTRMEVLPAEIDGRVMELKPVDYGPEFRSAATEDTASPSDIRAWQDGDSLKRVHWKLSLRKRELMVRTYEETARPDTLVIVDLSEITAMPEQRRTIEDVVCEQALAAVREQLGAGYSVRMPLMSKNPSECTGAFPQDTDRFAEALMRATFDSPYPYDHVLMQMLTRLQRTGGAILVTPHLTMRVADMALRLHGSGATARLIWVAGETNTEAESLLARLKASGVDVHRADPWKKGT